MRVYVLILCKKRFAAFPPNYFETGRNAGKMKLNTPNQ